MNEIGEFVKALGTYAAAAGLKLPGGCEDCNAQQGLKQHAPGVWVIQVAHDDTCPTLRALEDGGPDAAA